MSAQPLFKKLPSAMAVQRGLVVSDALFFNADASGAILGPVLVIEHGLRGTQNVNTEAGADKDIANPQRTETAKLSEEAERLLVRFDVRAASLEHAIAMCAEPGAKAEGKKLGLEMREALEGFIERSRGEATVQLALRYARNLLNARWLWRNRTYAKAVEVRVFLLEGGKVKGGPIATADALKTPLGHFNDPTSAERAIAQVLAQGWDGDPDASALRVEAHVDFGVRGAIEVFPSQNYVERVKGFARSLYKLPLRSQEVDLGSGFDICGHAALRDQKIGNALRTLDTWYADFEQSQLVTPIEPMAANLALGQFLRQKKETAFELLKNINNTDPCSDNGQFLLAILIRGGVFGEKTDKGEGKDKGEDAEAGE